MKIFMLLLLLTQLGSAEKRPDHIQYGKFNYPVHYVKVINYQGNTSWDGMTYCKGHYVEVVDNLDYDTTAETLIHEALHVATSCEEKNLTIHEAIYRFAPIFQALLLENPQLARYLTRPPLDISPPDEFDARH